jgi:hypothetical protein
MDRESTAIDRLIDEYRDRCLWFLRQDYYPSTPEQQEQVLTFIERYGDAAGWRRARELRSWLSHRSSGTSVVR